MTQVVISSSVLIAVILIARFFLKERISRRLQYALWLLVALRLMIPVQFGQAQYSVATLVQQAEKTPPVQQIQDKLEEPVAGPSRQELYEQVKEEYLEQSGLTDVPEPSAPQKPILPPKVEQQLLQEAQDRIEVPTLSEVLGCVWLCGVAAMTVWFTLSNLLFLSRAKKGTVETLPDISGARVLVSEGVPTPCLVGLFRPTIYLTPGCRANATVMAHVIAHEKTHWKHLDHIWAWVRSLCLCIYWFHPLVWVAAVLSKRDCELACDEGALKELGDGERIAYGKTLLEMVSHRNAAIHVLEMATAMNETKKQLKERVRFIASKPKHLLIAAICVVLVVALTAGCAFAGGEAAPTAGAVGPSDGPSEPETSVTQPTQTEPQEPVTVELRVWATGSTSWLRAMENAFQEQYPQYHIQWKNGDGIVSRIPDEAPRFAPEVFLFGSDLFYDLADEGALQRLEGPWEEQVRSDHSVFTCSTVTYTDGGVYAFPIASDCGVLCYDKTVYTQEDVRSLDTLLEKGRVAIDLGGGFQSAFFLGCGGSLDGSDGFDVEAGVRFGGADGGYTAAKKLLQVIAHPNFVYDDALIGLELLDMGQADAAFALPENILSMNSRLGDRMGIVPLPSFEADGQICRMRIPAKSQCVGVCPAACEDDLTLELSMAFASFLASREGQLLRYEYHGVAPAAKTLLDDEQIQADPLVVAQIRCMEECGSPWARCLRYMDYWKDIDRFGSQCLDGTIDLENYKEMVDRFW